MQLHSHSAEELRTIAGDFARTVVPVNDGATVVTLSGDLGAGKTTFTQGLAHALGVEETVASPTFILEKRYLLSGQRWKQLIHIDAYRLNGTQELKALEWEGIVGDAGNLILLEWPERIPGAVPESAISIHFAIEGDGRIITINGGESGKKEDSSGI
jgi:tRNA threonylcarbamoyladenosine biosynthesis protein TsaE